MYIPKSFRVSDTGTLHDLITAHPFGILVGALENAPYASHIPFFLDRDAGAQGTLIAHLAQNNPQAELFDTAQEMLAIFQGPHGYVSPRWYAPGNAVPTWNYAVVHAYGTPIPVTDRDRIRQQQDQLVTAYEGAEGWRMDSQPEAYLDGMMQGITAFEMPINRLEGKFKLSQNRPVADRESVIAALSDSGLTWDRALAEMMRRYSF